MARDRYYLFGTICLSACFFVVNGISSASSYERYHYSTDSPHRRMEHSLSLELLKGQELHNHQKRDVESPQMASSTPIPVSSPEKVKNLKPLKDTSTKPPENVPITPKRMYNLGENGAGQRKNISEPEKKDVPPKIKNDTLVKQHLGLLQNAVNSVNTPVKITPLKDLEVPPPEPVAPEDVGVGDELDKDDLADQNITTKMDTHIFYNSTIYNNPNIGKSFWVEMPDRNDFKINDLLSNSHRRAATIKLSFEFPFYGHYIKNVTIATGGFLYTGTCVHSWLAATQYIAPLMANFDTSLSNNSLVKFVDNGTAFTVEWEKVLLQDKSDKGSFTFQTTLHKNGDIVFVYKNVPFMIEDIDDDHHPVKVGLSDAYILDRTVFFVRRKTIYEYHRVAFKKNDIKNWTSIYLRSLPTCLNLNNCSSCLLSELSLNCTWCPRMNQCSTGQDRHRQDWIDNRCDIKNITYEPTCASKESATEMNYDIEDPEKVFDNDYIGELPPQNQLGASGYVAIIFLIAMISGFGFWTVYAYRNPHTASGQMLIRYRPSQWRWRRGEARYTAATIHM